MKILRKIIENKIIVFVIDIILIIIAINYCKEIFDLELNKAIFTNELEGFSKENKNPIFKIGKIVLYSSATAVDNSDGKLEDICISQFTDIAIYLNNKNIVKELTPENTVKEMYIDNIKITENSVEGEKIFNYKNPYDFGKYVLLNNFQNDIIPLNVSNTNDEINYSENNVFYTDCSNPLTLGYINNNFITNGKVSDTTGHLQFDGTILKSANVNLQELSGKIEFYINLKNNLGEKFICNLVIDNNLEMIKNNLLNGYSLEINETEGQEYNFLKVSE